MKSFVYKSVIILSLIFQPTISNCNGVHCSIDVTGTYPQILPRRVSRSSVAYDASEDTIIILGGSSSNKQYVTFKASIFNDKGTNYMNDGVSGTGQFYSQLDNILWMINPNTPTFIAMNTPTRTVTYPSINITTDVGSRGCLATMNWNNNKFLFVVGGYNSNDGYLNSVQVYNINSQQWSNLPTMQTARRSAACVVNNNILYVVGGKTSNGLRISSVEYFDIVNYFSNVPNQQWTYTNNDLNTPIDSCIATKYGNNIFVIGGVDNNNNYPTDINIININTKSISVNGSLVRGVMNPSVIVVGNILYVFAGIDVNGISDEYQYIHLYPTSNPSITPTQYPSYQPTNTPTLNPSITPTKFPTVSPSITPSNMPTASPTLIRINSLTPSISPTLNPTINNLDSASGEIKDDIISTLMMEHIDTENNSSSSSLSLQYLMYVVTGCGLCFCVIGVALFYVKKKRTEALSIGKIVTSNSNNLNYIHTNNVSPRSEQNQLEFIPMTNMLRNPYSKENGICEQRNHIVVPGSVQVNFITPGRNDEVIDDMDIVDDIDVDNIENIDKLVVTKGNTDVAVTSGNIVDDVDDIENNDISDDEMVLTNGNILEETDNSTDDILVDGIEVLDNDIIATMGDHESPQ